MYPKIKKLYKKDNDFQHLEVIKRNRNKRFQSKEVFVEGVEPISLALSNSWEVLAFVYTRDRTLSDWAEGILKHSTASIHYELSKELMDLLSDKENASELLAVLSMPSDDFSRIQLSSNPLIAVFDRPSDPGNLGTIIRSCNAFKADGLIITGHCVDLYEPKVIRSSLGAVFSMPVLRKESYKDLLSYFDEIRKNHGDLQIIGTSVHTDDDIVDQDFTRPTILIIGNETSGMSYNYKEISDCLVKIPIYGSASSLNVACAVSIIFYEIDRQRRVFKE